MESVKECHSKSQAKAQFESIVEMVKDLLDADDDMRDEAEQVIHEDPLSVQVKSGWHAPTAEVEKPEEYEILLCTGGPAVRIIGELNEYLEPDTARIEHQDWGTPWTNYSLTTEEQGTVLVYARCFYFGE